MVSGLESPWLASLARTCILSNLVTPGSRWLWGWGRFWETLFPVGSQHPCFPFSPAGSALPKTPQALLSPAPHGGGAPAFAETSEPPGSLGTFLQRRGGGTPWKDLSAQTQASALSLFTTTSVFAGFCGPRRVLVYPGGAGREGSLNSPGYIWVVNIFKFDWYLLNYLSHLVEKPGKDREAMVSSLSGVPGTQPSDPRINCRIQK